jgi:hypothetical protein
MTINLADNNPRIEYTVAQGVTQDSFAVPFEFFNDGDLSVYVDGVLKAEGTDYTITGGDGSTGDIEFVAATPPDVQQVTGITGGSKVTIIRTTPIERTSDFSAGADINRAALNEQFDILTAMVADAKDRIDRTIRANPYEVSPSLVLPTVASRKGKVLAFDATTGAVINGPTIDEVINAEDYAVAAAASAAAASDSEDAAAASEAAAASSESHAASSEAAAAASEAAAATSETNAAASETNAAASEAAASASEIAAAASEVAAALSETNAAASEATASSAASTAESARDATLAAFDNFDDRYLGSKTSDPALDNDGNALVGGTLYFNSVEGVMKIYTGSAWVVAYVPGVASSIGFTPAGDIAATNVQTAIQELDSEKVPRTSTTGAAVIPSGTEAQRPTPATGQLRFNTDAASFEGYNGTEWGSIGGGATSDAIYENSATIAEDITIVTGRNGMSTGPITINSGVTVTVESGARYVVI